MSYLNKDKLLIKFGTENAVPNQAGEYSFDGPRHCIEINIPDMTKIVSTNGGSFLSDQVFFPKNARIESIEVISETACTGTGAVLNIGLISSADRTTEIDFNGIVAAIPVTSLATAGQYTHLHEGDTYAGALLGTTNSTVGYLVADYDTAAFTAGAVKMRLYYHTAGA